MLVEERTNNVVLAELPPVVCCAKNGTFINDVSFGNESVNDVGNIGSFSADGIRTYKRRKRTRMGLESNSPEEVRVSVAAEGQLVDQDLVSCHQDREKGRRISNLDGSTVMEPQSQATVDLITEQCQRVFQNVLASENFKMLCELLCGNFRGVRVESIAEFSSINSRMREGTYGLFPALFHTDIQQVWRKFQEIGEEMVSLATVLSDMSRISYIDQFGVEVVSGISREGKHEEFNSTCSEQRRRLNLNTRKVSHSLKCDQQTKQEQAEISGLDKVCICRLCGEKANGKDYLVCDLCEEIYHISCIRPPVEEIPPRNWYCANCTTTGIESPHENCVVCERISFSVTHKHAGGDENESNPEDMLSNSEEKSVSSIESEEIGVQFPKKERILNRPCKLCQGKIEEGQKFKVCEHQFCLYRIYHEHCLTSNQLEYHGPHWYCLSCLCRTCLTNKDDDKIVLCDGCDQAYHMYCLDPPLTSIPKGKWFCKKCEKEIQKIRKAKRAFQRKNREKKQRKNRPNETNRVVGGSVDMLLTAALKLKNEETLAVVERER